MKPTLFVDVAKQVDVPDDSTISKTIYQDDRLKVVLFGFAPGQELSEHTAAVPAIVHFLEGEARVTLSDEVIEAQPNSWIHMPARMPHSVLAETQVKMLLLLQKEATG